MNENKKSEINCIKCVHFVTTWNPKFPRACRLYGFQGKQWPSIMVFNSTGEPCLGYVQKIQSKK